MLKRPSILVLGAGYGGLTTVVNLQKEFGTDAADITLINKNEYHYESTWLHEAAAGTLLPEQVRYDIADVIDTGKVNFVQATVEGIDVDSKKVSTDNGEFTYDYLVIGLGFEGETFGIVANDPSLYEGTIMKQPPTCNFVKAGMINYTRQLASYYGKRGVRANCISPGGYANNQPQPFVDAYCKRAPLGRLLGHEDIKGAAVFLASDASSYVTGHNLMVDGGWTII